MIFFTILGSTCVDVMGTVRPESRIAIVLPISKCSLSSVRPPLPSSTTTSDGYTLVPPVGMYVAMTCSHPIKKKVRHDKIAIAMHARLLE
jgi:hypothetical protein